MPRTLYIYSVIFLYLSAASVSILAQEQNISKYLQAIEAGEFDYARTALATLKENYPSDASVKFLEAVLTENGEQAYKIYTDIITNHANSNYADAALFRVFSYYYSLGLYKQAEEYKITLINNYPKSPYVSAVNRSLPDTDDNIVMQKPVTSEKVQTESVAKKQFYTIQAGAFLNINNAKKLKDKFERSGYFSSIFPKDIGGSILNVVIVGQFDEESKAKVFSSEIKNKFAIDGRIIIYN